MEDGNPRYGWPELIGYQSGVAGRQQAVRKGISAEAIKRRFRSGKWQRMQRGVYATFSGEPPRDAVLWAAVRRAGPGAVLSHQTAAEIQGLADRPSAQIHVTVPVERNPARYGKLPGVVVHRSRWVAPDPQPDWRLPRTRIDDTVLDLAAAARTLDDAYDWISRATGRQLTTAESLREALAARKKIRRRAWLDGALDDAAEGINSALERRYVHGVERAHGLPAARRQVRRRPGTKSIYLDNYYEKYRLCVELDGQASHPPERRWHDSRRDNANLAADDTRTLRYGWADVTTGRCGCASQIAAVLGRRGWAQATLRRCGPGCAVGRP
ncbi:MAG: hypothetical protein JOY82_28425 [Streptosporangiaceae bacterium]|nr:hypothetical protein [Streptosporangiaceae bacterium]MBV9858411.1 hypothetical protein [Streptosporangiaceae bacterium]